MVDNIIERRSGYRRTLDHFPDKLKRIVGDVSTGVEDTPEADSHALMSDFVRSINKIIKRERGRYSSGGMYYEAMRVIQGTAFTGLPFAEQLAVVSQTAKKTESEKQELVSKTIHGFYEAFQQADSNDWRVYTVAWRNFVEAYGRFFVPPGVRGKLTGSFPAWKNPSKVYLYLPTLIGNYPGLKEKFHPDETSIAADTRLQRQLARATGILMPNETSWFDFINRDGIKIVDGTYQPTLEDEGIILGCMKQEQGLSSGDSLIIYTGVPTKYPEVKAMVAFDYYINGFVRRPVNLEDLINTGILSPRILLKAPTQILLGVA